MHKIKRFQDETDEELISQVSNGDAGAFALLVRRHLANIVSLSRRMLGDPVEAEDVAQEALLRLWSNASVYDSSKASLKTWLYRITGNLCIDRMRKKKNQGNTEPIEKAADIGEPAMQEQAIQEQQLENRVSAALLSLPDRQRQALVLCHYQGMRMKEACFVMDISIEALESLLARARRKLKKELETEWKLFVSNGSEVS